MKALIGVTIIGWIVLITYAYMTLSGQLVRHQPWMDTAMSPISDTRIADDDTGFYLVPSVCMTRAYKLIPSDRCKQAAIILPIKP